MAKDSTYGPNVYRERGGNRMVVAASGEFRIDGGTQNVGVATATEGGALAVNPGASFSLATGSSWTQSIRTATQSLTLDGSEAGQTIVTTVGNVTHTVPLASTNQGAAYTFVLGTGAVVGAGATGLHIRHQGSNKFIGGGLTVATNQSLVLLGATDVAGDSVRLIAQGSRYWITNVVGGWSAITAT